MFLQSTFVTEFLAETNLTLTQEDFGSKLSDVLVPIRTYLQKEKNILSFSLARYAGASTQLAFFCEWYFHTNRLTQNSQPLFAENHEYLEHKIPENFSVVTNISSIVDKQIIRWYLPFQLSILQYKTKEQITDLISKNGYLNRYLSGKYLSQITAGEIDTAKGLLLEKIPLNQYIEAQGFRLSFLQISLPCLLGFLYNFHQHDSPINPKGVKWFMVEEILARVAILHQSANSPELALYIHRLGMSESEELAWLGLPRASQIQMAQLDESVSKQLKNIRDRLKNEAQEKLDKLIFPEKYKEMLQDLIDWSYVFEMDTEHL